MKHSIEIEQYFLTSNAAHVTYFNGEESREITVNRPTFSQWLLKTGRFAVDYWNSAWSIIYSDLAAYLIAEKSEKVLPKTMSDILEDYDSDIN